MSCLASVVHDLLRHVMHEGISLFTYIRCFSYLVILSGDFFCTFYSPSSRWWKQSWYRLKPSLKEVQFHKPLNGALPWRTSGRCTKKQLRRKWNDGTRSQGVARSTTYILTMARVGGVIPISPSVSTHWPCAKCVHC